MKLIEKIKIGELWFACDTPDLIRHLKRISEILKGIPLNKKRCYVLVGFNGETIKRAEQRLNQVFELGFLPFAQFYRGPGEQPKTREWIKLLKKWCRPAAIKAREENSSQLSFLN